MNFTETTASFTTISQRTVSGITDKYVRCGSNIMVRQFNPSMVHSGSWSELWIGFRWRISSSYNFNTSSLFGSTVDPFGEYSTFEFGLCRTTGSVYGQSGSVNTSLQHSLGYRKSDAGGSGTTYWQLSTSGSLYTMATGGGFMVHRVTGSFTQHDTTFMAGRHMRTFVNTNYFTSSHRSLFVLRIITGSSSQAMQASYMYPNHLNSSSMASDFSSSAIMADIMESTSWSTASIASAKYGYLTTDVNDDIPVSQSLYGYFDGVFFSWKRLYDSMDISDIVIRTIP